MAGASVTAHKNIQTVFYKRRPKFVRWPSFYLLHISLRLLCKKYSEWCSWSCVGK